METILASFFDDILKGLVIVCWFVLMVLVDWVFEVWREHSWVKEY